MAGVTTIQYGRPEPYPKPLELRAGPLTALFEKHTGFLRYVRLGDHEVIRAIYGAIRDGNWATIPPEVSNVQAEVARDSFRISFGVRCRNGAVDYFWRGAITGETSGQISYAFEGEARSVFSRNRIGLCVHHPVSECAGKPCVIEHADGTSEDGVFPKNISPTQPFFNIRAVTCEVATTGVRAEIRFTGEVFEMEDQRNWTDASYKTYSTPLSLPAPVTVQAGERVSQMVTLSLRGLSKPVLPVLHGRPPQISLATTPVLSLPPIGLYRAQHGQALTEREIGRLRALKLSHLRADLTLASGEYVSVLKQASTEAAQLNTGLHLALILSANAAEELASLQPHLADMKAKVLLWLILAESDAATGDTLTTAARVALQKYLPGVLLARGTRMFFADVNRSSDRPNDTEFLCYPVNPQVHHSDILTLTENLAGQAYTVETARQLSSKPVVISPITLKSRFNPDMALAPHGAAAFPGDVDVRQSSLFGAGWTLGSIARLAATGNVHSLTYYETTGWYGIMERETGSPAPEFPSVLGGVFPVYHLLADIGEFPTRQVYPTHSSHPLLVEGLTLSDGKRRRILLASFSAEPLEVKIKTGTCRARIRYLDESNALQAMENPEQFRGQQGAVAESVAGKIDLRLLPFALARVDMD